jgi:hypothetical protein
MSHITYIVPDEATLLEVSEQAEANHLHIISNGRRTVLSPTIPAGWHRLIVMVRTPTHARLARQA